jgi:hypothetical protein
MLDPRHNLRKGTLMTTTTHATENEGVAPMSQVSNSEAAILNRIVQPDQPTFSAEAAHGILALDFNQADKERMHQLSAKAREGTLTPEEQAALNNYERVGHLINILQSKARLSLKTGGRPSGKGKAR